MNPKCKTCKHKLNSVFNAPCSECSHSDQRYTDRYEAAIKPDCDSCKHQNTAKPIVCSTCNSDYSNFEPVTPEPVVSDCNTCHWGTFPTDVFGKCASCDTQTFSNYQGVLPVAPPTLVDFQPPVADRTTVLSPEHAAPYATHPLQEAYDAAIAQATGGKGVRHGGNSTPFMEQRWYRIAKSTGEGGLLFQGIKKAEEAGDKEDDEAFERELLGSLVYLGMTYLYFKRHGRK